METAEISHSGWAIMVWKAKWPLPVPMMRGAGGISVQGRSVRREIQDFRQFLLTESETALVTGLGSLPAETKWPRTPISFFRGVQGYERCGFAGLSGKAKRNGVFRRRHWARPALMPPA
jgi:hypothetical protein